MFSDGTYKEIDRLTDRALREIQILQVIDRVTVIRGYQQRTLSSPAPATYEGQLIMAVQELAGFVREHQKLDLAEHLQTLGSRMDQELDH